MAVNKQYLAYVILGSWALFIGTAFWWFQFRHISAFEDHLATFNGSELQQIRLQPSPHKRALVVHFIDADCPCSRFSYEHIDSLEATFQQTAEFRHWSGGSHWPDQLPVPVTPSVAIWSANGELAYFGPYSSGSFCGEGEDLVATILDHLNRDSNPEWINQDAVGCFCPWRQHNEVAPV